MGLSNCVTDSPITDSIPILILAASASFIRSLTAHLRLDSHRSDDASADASTSAVFSGLVTLADFLTSNRAFDCVRDGDTKIEDCVVCLSGMREGERVRRLSCRHVFHSDCLEGWFDQMTLTCPLCRSPLLR